MAPLASPVLAGGLHDNVNAHGSPIEVPRLLDVVEGNCHSVDHEICALKLDRLGEAAINRVVLQEIGECLGVCDVGDGPDLDCAVGVQQTEDVAPNSAEAHEADAGHPFSNPIACRRGSKPTAGVDETSCGRDNVAGHWPITSRSTTSM